MLLSARQLVGFTVAVTRKVHFFQNFVQSFRSGFLALQFHCQSNVRAHGKFGQNVVFLKNEAYERVAVTVEVRLRKVIAGLSFYDEFAFVRAVKSAQYVQKSGFTASGFTQDKHHSLVFEFKTYVVKRLYGYAFFGTVSLSHVFYLEHNFLHIHFLPCVKIITYFILKFNMYFDFCFVFF